MNDSYEKNEAGAAGSLFSMAAQTGAMFYGYMKLDDLARGTKIIEQAKKTSSITGKTLEEVAGNVYTRFNVPFGGKLDGAFGNKTTELVKGVSWSNSLKTLDETAELTTHSINSAFKANNKDMLKIFEKAGASKDEIKEITKIIETRNKGSLKNFFGSKKAFSGTVDDVAKNILKDKGLSLTDDAGKSFLNIMNKYGGKLKGSPHLIGGQTGIGLSLNLTTLAKTSPKLFSALGFAARATNIIGQAYFAYEIAKGAGDFMINKNKNSESHRRQNERKTLKENDITYAQASSFNETVLNRRVEASVQASIERDVLTQALSAGNKVNEVMRSALGGYSDNLTPSKIR